ncbi:MAG: single-stranded DNA-binding protein [Comamonadaceae bacterium]|nr:MAG: single-stranded DNA-binding protein [Comamonadaceae bacterium]
MAQLFGLARIGRDAELRTTGQGDQVATLSLAFTYGRKGADGKRPTQWVEGALWGKLAEALTPYLTKGTQVSVTLDDTRIETFRKSDGTDGLKLAGRVTSIELAGSGERTAPAPAPRPAPAAAPRAPAAATRAASGFDDMDDDIPF